MPVRLFREADFPRWIALRAELWPEEAPAGLEAQGRTALAAEPPLTIFVAEEGGSVVGFLELGFRAYAEGCTSSPVPYVEGWYVGADWRRRGIGGALMRAAEEWSRSRGFPELASDTLADNRLSRTAHEALGFEEMETLVVFRKAL